MHFNKILHTCKSNNWLSFHGKHMFLACQISMEERSCIKTFRTTLVLCEFRKAQQGGECFRTWPSWPLQGQFISPGRLLVPLTRLRKYKRKSSMDKNMSNNGNYNTDGDDKDSRKESIFEQKKTSSQTVKTNKIFINHQRNSTATEKYVNWYLTAAEICCQSCFPQNSYLLHKRTASYFGWT